MIRCDEGHIIIEERSVWDGRAVREITQQREFDNALGSIERCFDELNVAEKENVVTFLLKMVTVEGRGRSFVFSFC